MTITETSKRNNPEIFHIVQSSLRHLKNERNKWGENGKKGNKKGKMRTAGGIRNPVKPGTE